MLLNILIIIVAVIVLTLIIHFVIKAVRKCKESNQVDEFERSKKYLVEYTKMSPFERLEHYENMRLVIRYLHNIVKEAQGEEYDLQGILNRDYLHTDVRMLNYYNISDDVDFVSLNEAKRNFDYPIGQFKITNCLTGKYVKNGLEKKSLSISVDNQLLSMCERWLDEMSRIKELTSNE